MAPVTASTVRLTSDPLQISDLQLDGSLIDVMYAIERFAPPHLLPQLDALAEELNAM